ncbi:MAG: SDR family oxidoreductase [Deltaproteobacteria bacterium]|nr:SDR family oxidoreductase [Deltaproteobacteria bacterium]
MAHSMKTAFVTGATGFIGQHVVEQLTAAGYRVVVFHRASSNTSRLAKWSPTLASGSLESVDSIAAAIPEGCDALFHVAANTSQWRGDRALLERDNVLATRNVVEAALKRGVQRFVATSSESAWGEPARQPLDETVPQRGAESWVDYERTKYLAELEVMKGVERGLAAVIVNPAHVLGRYDENSWGRTFRLLRDGKIPGAPPGSGSWAWGEQVAKAHLAAAEKGRVGERYLLGGPQMTYVELFAEIARLLGKKPVPALPGFALRAFAQVQQLVSRFTHRAPDVTPEIAYIGCEHRAVRSDKAIRELGYATVPVEFMLKDCYDWLVAEGRI